MPRKQKDEVVAESAEAPKKERAHKDKSEKKVKKESKEDKPKEKSEKKEKKSKKEVAPEVEVKAEAPVAEADGEKKTTRREITPETLDTHFNTVLSFVEDEVAALRADPKNGKGGKSGIRVLKTLGRHLKELRAESKRAIKYKPKKKRTTNNKNSGFAKPLTVSGDLAKFCDRKPTDMMSRNDVTRNICAYIREHKLQDPEDGRNIVPDKKLTSLLNYDPKEHGTLTYPYIQKLLVPHYKAGAAAAAEAEAPKKGKK